MNGYLTYQIYQSLKLHFTSDYDAVKYNFKTAVRQDTFERRRDRYFFEKLSRKYKKENLIHYFTSNLIQNPSAWIGDMSEKVYYEYLARHDKLSYTFTQDMKFMANQGYSFENICTTSEDNSNNPLLESLRTDEIHFESVILVDILVNFLKPLRSHLSDPLGIHTDLINTLLKYKIIMQIKQLPLSKAKNTILSIFKS